MNKKLITFIFIALILLTTGCIQSGAQKESQLIKQNEQTTQNQEITTQINSSTEETIQKTETANVHEFNVVGSNYKFDINEIKVKKSDKVKIIFKNKEGFHDFKIDELNAATKVIKSGEEDTIEFIADKTGTFEYYCSVGQHRAMGMKGKLLVE